MMVQSRSNRRAWNDRLLRDLFREAPAAGPAVCRRTLCPAVDRLARALWLEDLPQGCVLSQYRCL